jgi:Holliday junction resolvase RusA-like endonuclease
MILLGVLVAQHSNFLKRRPIRILNIIVYGEPQGKARPRVVRRNGRSVTYTPEKTTDYEAKIRAAYIDEVGNNRLFADGDSVNLAITAFFEIPKSTSAIMRQKMVEKKVLPAKKPDIDNIAKIVMDALNPCASIGFVGAWKDDICVTSLSIRKYYSAEPGLLVYMEKNE